MCDVSGLQRRSVETAGTAPEERHAFKVRGTLTPALCYRAACVWAGRADNVHYLPFPRRRDTPFASTCVAAVHQGISVT
jgi:hypothetical protein